MEETKKNVLVCNFTDSYRKIHEPEDVNYTVCELSDIGESSGYCSDRAADEIRRRLWSAPLSGIHYIDDGNHHYLSRLWIEKIEEPFDLVVFDHHTDMQPSVLLPFLSCGNWILKSLQEVRMLREVWIIGPPEDAFADTEGFADRVHMVPQEEAEKNVPKLPSCDRPVYISADLDVLSPDEFMSIWDQGSMTKKKLREWMEYLHTARRVLGVDLCG